MSWGNESDYNEWLEEICEEDTPEISGWFNCEDNERSQYLEDHPNLFDHPNPYED